MLKRIFKSFIFFGLLLSAVVGYLYHKNFIKSNVDTKGKETFIFIPKNADKNEVKKVLFRTGVVMDTASLSYMMELKKFGGRNVVPGKYKVEQGLSNNQLINHLRSGNGRLDSRIQFHNVQTISQFAGKICKELLLDSVEIESYLVQPAVRKKYGFKENTLLSMFIPNTYFVDVDITMPELMERMANEYKKFWNTNRMAKVKKSGLSRSEVVTLASIVYWETKLNKDMPVVAGVYMNRLKVGMPLQADPTLIYVHEQMGLGTLKRVLNKHKELDSPYNTYKYKGLPPGPILVPPPVYVDAVLNYAKHNYYYFVAKETLNGESYFSNSYRQHLIYAKRYQNMMNQRKRKSR